MQDQSSSKAVKSLQERRREAKARGKRLFGARAAAVEACRCGNEENGDEEQALILDDDEHVDDDEDYLNGRRYLPWSCQELMARPWMIIIVCAWVLFIFVFLWWLIHHKNALGYIAGGIVMLCLTIASSLQIHFAKSQERERRKAVEVEMRIHPEKMVKAGTKLTRHLGDRVVVMHGVLDTTEIQRVIDLHWEELRMLTTGDEGFDKVGRSPPFYREFIDPEGGERYEHLPDDILRVVSRLLYTTRELASQNAPCENRQHLMLSRSFLARNPNEVGWHTDCGYSSVIVYIGGQNEYTGGELEFQDPASGEDLVAAFTFQPKDGDVVLFHTSLYHRVAPSKLGSRPTAMICFTEDERYFDP